MAVPVVPTPDGPETALGTDLPREPGARRGRELRSRLGLDRDAGRGRAGRARGADLGREHGDARASRATSTCSRPTARSRAGSASSTTASAPRTWRSWSPRCAAIGLIVPADVDLLGGLFAFGATIAFTIAHLSMIRLRITEPDRDRARSGSRSTSTCSAAGVPLPTLVAAMLTALAWLSVIVYHDTRPLGRRRAGWSSGWSSYVIYRKGFEGTPLTERVEVPAGALVKDLGRRRVRRHPRAGLRDAARRRHRRHGRAPRAGRRPAGRDRRRGSR